MTTGTPGRTPPEASATTPSIFPVAAVCASAVELRRLSSAEAQRSVRRCCIGENLIAGVEDRYLRAETFYSAVVTTVRQRPPAWLAALVDPTIRTSAPGAQASVAHDSDLAFT